MGYEVDGAKLTDIAFQLRAGRSAMDEIAGGLPDAVDAGFSSDVANAALARIGKVALALGSQGESMADRIDVTRGAYRTAEESAESDVHLAEEDLAGSQNEERSPLKQAPDEPGTEHKNRPAPTPAPPGRAPSPPSLAPPAGPAAPN